MMSVGLLGIVKAARWPAAGVNVTAFACQSGYDIAYDASNDVC
jgi:hypothetical protein